MIKLNIKKINKYIYEFEYNTKIYKSNIEFYNFNIILKENDVIYMNEKLLKEINNSVANFEQLNADAEKLNQEDVIVIISNNKKYYLKRVYG